MNEEETRDLLLIKQAVQKLMAAAKIESSAMEAVQDHPTEEPLLHALYQTHLDELDAIQALLLHIGLIERHAYRGPNSDSRLEDDRHALNGATNVSHMTGRRIKLLWLTPLRDFRAPPPRHR